MAGDVSLRKEKGKGLHLSLCLASVAIWPCLTAALGTWQTGDLVGAFDQAGRKQ